MGADLTAGTLGVQWDQQRDAILFSFAPRYVGKEITKRTILSISASLFDPLGLLTSLLIVVKMLIQELWILKLEWDESVPQHIHRAWMDVLVSLSSLNEIVVPRYCLQPSHTHSTTYTDFAMRQFEHMGAAYMFALWMVMETSGWTYSPQNHEWLQSRRNRFPT